MHEWEPAAVLFFGYLAAVSRLARGATPRRRLAALLLATAGAAASAGASLLPGHSILHDWVVPPLLLLLAYWTSGLLFSAAMPAAERQLEALDARLRVDAVAAATPRWLSELLELAYLAVYPVVPAALAVHLFMTPSPSADRFWTVVLATDFVCFGLLPWVQTRPPRTFRPPPPWASRVRRLNARLLDRTSIRVNTFPSGHAAEALAAALLVASAPWPIAAAFALIAVMITAGTVLGRYHYAADAIAGWAVALGVWAAVG
jgi:membrane-associated phospholipid phosphatase